MSDRELTAAKNLRLQYTDKRLFPIVESMPNLIPEQRMIEVDEGQLQLVQPESIDKNDLKIFTRGPSDIPPPPQNIIFLCRLGSYTNILKG